jgi:hypothetical protein
VHISPIICVLCWWHNCPAHRLISGSSVRAGCSQLRISLLRRHRPVARSAFPGVALCRGQVPADGQRQRELARAGARGCRREAARRAPEVLRRSGRTTAAVPCRAHRAHPRPRTSSGFSAGLCSCTERPRRPARDPVRVEALGGGVMSAWSAGCDAPARHSLLARLAAPPLHLAAHSGLPPVRDPGHRPSRAGRRYARRPRRRGNGPSSWRPSLEPGRMTL